MRRTAASNLRRVPSSDPFLCVPPVSPIHKRVCVFFLCKHKHITRKHISPRFEFIYSAPLIWAGIICVVFLINLMALCVQGFATGCTFRILILRAHDTYAVIKVSPHLLHTFCQLALRWMRPTPYTIFTSLLHFFCIMHRAEQTFSLCMCVPESATRTHPIVIQDQIYAPSGRVQWERKTQL